MKTETVKHTPNFENFLHEYFSEQNPEILDDMLPDCTSDWIAGLDSEQWIRLGNLYAKKYSVNDELLEALKKARDHLDYCGYGDSWESECADAANLPEKIEQAIAKAEGGQS